MTAALGIALLAFAALALLSVILSLPTALALRFASRWLDRIAPAAQARVLLAASLLPMLASVLLVATSLAPSLGLIADHCLSSDAPHAHPHLCTEHHVVALPEASVVLLAIYLGVRFLGVTLRLAVRSIQAARTAGRLDALSSASSRRVRILRMDEPQAFVLGLLSPTIYVSDALAVADQGAWLEIAIAHEKAHVARRDPLWKAIASLGLAFHLPGIAGWLARRLACAQEMAADETSAAVTGGRTKVAEALVRLARVRATPPTVPMAATAFGAGDLEARVRSLLRDVGPNHPSARSLVTTAMTAALFAAWKADWVHHAVETMLGLVH